MTNADDADFDLVHFNCIAELKSKRLADLRDADVVEIGVSLDGMPRTIFS